MKTWITLPTGNEVTREKFKEFVEFCKLEPINDPMYKPHRNVEIMQLQSLLRFNVDTVARILILFNGNVFRVRTEQPRWDQSEGELFYPGRLFPATWKGFEDALKSTTTLLQRNMLSSSLSNEIEQILETLEHFLNTQHK